MSDNDKQRPSNIGKNIRNFKNVSIGSFFTFCVLTYATFVKDLDGENSGQRKGIKTLSIAALSALFIAIFSGHKYVTLSNQKENSKEKSEERDQYMKKEFIQDMSNDNTLCYKKNYWKDKLLINNNLPGENMDISI